MPGEIKMEDNAEVNATATSTSASTTSSEVQEVEIAGIEAGNKDNDKCFEKHLVSAERAKSKYQRLYREMVDKLSTTHFEPFNKVLLEHDKQVALLDQDEVLQKFKDKLLGMLLPSLDATWEGFNISTSITTLEMLKERYKECEGHNWNAADMTPYQRSLPLFVRYKQMSKRFLELQIASQNKKLEELIETNSKQRARIQEITNRRILLQEAMDRHLKEQDQLKERIDELTEELAEL